MCALPRTYYEGGTPDWLPVGDSFWVDLYCVNYDVNPYLIMAIGQEETSWGTQGWGRYGYHLGVGCYGPNQADEAYKGLPAQLHWACNALKANLPPSFDLDSLTDFATRIWRPGAPDAWAKMVWIYFNRLFFDLHDPYLGAYYGTKCKIARGSVGVLPTTPSAPAAPTFGGLPGTLVGLAQWIYNNIWAPVSGWVLDLREKFSGLLAFLAVKFESVIYLFQSVWGSVFDWFSNLVHLWVWFFKAIINSVVYLFQSVWGSVFDFFSHLYGAAVWLLRNTWNSVVYLFQSVWGSVFDFFSHLYGAAVWLLRNTWNSVVYLFQSVWGSVFDFFSHLYGAAVWLLRTVFNSVVFLFESVWGAVFLIFSTWWGLVWDLFVNIYHWLAWVFRKGAEVIASFASNPLGTLIGFALNVAGAVIGGIFKLLLDLIDRLW